MKLDLKIDQQYLTDDFSKPVYLARHNNTYYIMTSKHGYLSYNMDYANVIIKRDKLEKYFEPVENINYVSYISSKKKFCVYCNLYKCKTSDTFIMLGLDLNKQDEWNELNEDMVYKENHFKVHKLFYKKDNEKLKEAIDFYHKVFSFSINKETTINIIIKTISGYKFKEFEISPIPIDIDKHYNNDFKPVHEHIVEGLTKSKKGIVLLHGEPGTGKTNYIKHLTGLVSKKNFVFVPSSMLGALADPSFIENLIDNKNSVIVLEDCELYIKDRKFETGNNNFVSTLLNVADGILSDVLSIQIICTFNTDLRDIDTAILREGRLISEYKFDYLEEEKAKIILKEEGVDLGSIKNYTLANLYNTKNKAKKTEQIKTKKIGF